MWPRYLLRIIVAVILFDGLLWGAEAEKKIPILCYHRFSDRVKDSMTIKTSQFEKQLAWLKSNGYKVISLEDAIGYLQGKIEAIPDKSVVITADDGHKSVYANMAPLVKKYDIPVTLFIYPSAISNARYAMSWKELRELESTTLFRVESHSYWHPNFKHEKKKLSPKKYKKFLDFQLAGSKRKLEKKMGHPVKYLAWPFGIYNEELEKQAILAGYVAAFTIEQGKASRSDPIMELPRYIIVGKYNISRFANIVKEK